MEKEKQLMSTTQLSDVSLSSLKLGQTISLGFFYIVQIDLLA